MPLLHAYALNKKHAIIHTTSIDVKIMRLDKKQVTLSVFRQLDEELIFLSDGSLRGVPWGRVNYLWGDQEKSGVAFHVVWQDGNRLKRSPVTTKERVYIRHRWTWDEYVEKPDYPSARDFDTRKEYDDWASEHERRVMILLKHAEEMKQLDQLFIAI